MPTDVVADLRRRAEQARRLSDAIHSPKSRKELRELAESLDAEADRLEQSQPKAMPKPL